MWKGISIIILVFQFSFVNCKDATGQEEHDRVWNKFSKITGIGGYHKEDFTDLLKKKDICGPDATTEECNNGLIIKLLEFYILTGQISISIE